jgi:hypothetical protein
VLKTSPAGKVGTPAVGSKVNVELAAVAGWPLTVSPAKALATAVAPSAPLMFDAASFVATTAAAVTGIVTVAVLQFVIGLSCSQIWYSIV